MDRRRPPCRTGLECERLPVAPGRACLSPYSARSALASAAAFTSPMWPNAFAKRAGVMGRPYAASNVSESGIQVRSRTSSPSAVTGNQSDGPEAQGGSGGASTESRELFGRYSEPDWRCTGPARRRTSCHLTTSNRKWVAPGVSIVLVLFSSIRRRPRASKSRVPSPNRTGMRWICISSSRPTDWRLGRVLDLSECRSGEGPLARQRESSHHHHHWEWG